jgi:hypothetical protein
VDELLRLHKPDATSLKKALVEGIDLIALKETNPTEYKMRLAQTVLQSSKTLAEQAGHVFFAAFPHHELFKLEHSNTTTLLSFPELSTKDLKRWDDALGRMVLHPKFSESFVYYRVIKDSRGEQRQLGLPLSAVHWKGHVDVLVGPFETQQGAETWGEEQVKPQQLMFDAVTWSERWFCDVFPIDI